VQQREIIRLILGIGALVFVLLHRPELKKLPAWGTLLTAFSLVLLSWTVAALEDALWPKALKLIEHSCYALSSLILAMWCWRLFATRWEEGHGVHRGG
jgi:predicted ferric reductase